MSRTVAVPDFGDSGSLYQHVEVAEPGDPGYPTPLLPEGDPWAPAVNQAVAEVEAERRRTTPKGLPAGRSPNPNRRPVPSSKPTSNHDLRSP